MDLNRATLIGRLTRDPELRTTPNGKNVASFGLATGRVWFDGAGNKQEKTEFHNCVLWGKLADIAKQYLVKGKQIYLEGRIENRNWEKDGVKHYRTEIVADNLIMLGAPRGTSSGPAATAPSQVNEIPTIDVVEEEIKVEDIPF